MKYIRTKETEYGCIIDTIKYKEQTGEECYIPKNEIIKQADTIEELLDRVVLHRYGLIRVDKDFALYRFEDNEVWYDITDTELKVGIYGAIWTDKGLIYVAKLNDKGEWELI